MRYFSRSDVISVEVWWFVFSVLFLSDRSQGDVSLSQRGPDTHPVRLHHGRDQQDEEGRGRPNDPAVRSWGSGEAPRWRHQWLRDGCLEQSPALLHSGHWDGALHLLHHLCHDLQVRRNPERHTEGGWEIFFTGLCLESEWSGPGWWSSVSSLFWLLGTLADFLSNTPTVPWLGDQKYEIYRSTQF